MITATTITDEAIRALNAEHAEHDEDSCPAGRAIHVGAMVNSAVALGVLSEGFPGARTYARTRCAEILNTLNTPKAAPTG